MQIKKIFINYLEVYNNNYNTLLGKKLLIFL